MKKSFIAFLAALGILTGGAAYGQSKMKGKQKGKAKTMVAATAMTSGTIKKGTALDAATPLVALADVLKDPASFAGKKVRIEGVIERSCTTMGCWMEIAAVKGGDTVRADTKHKFFIPLDAAGSKIMAEGEIAVKTINKEEAEHLASEGAKLRLNPDGTATEISFLATGVELSK